MKKLLLLSLTLTNAFMLGVQAGQAQPDTTQQTILTSPEARASAQRLLADISLDNFRDKGIIQGNNIHASLTPQQATSTIIEHINTLRPGLLRQWSLEKTLERNTADMYSLSFNAASSRIAIALYDGTVKVWALHNGQWILQATLQGQRGRPSVSFNTAGDRIVTASLSANKSASVWVFRNEEWNLEATLQGHTDFVESASFNAAGDHIVTTSWDKTAKVWILHDDQWNLDATLTGHTGRVLSASFNAAGNRMVTTSSDKTAKVWILRDGQWNLEATLQGHTHTIESASFNAAGDRIVTASGDNTAKVWVLHDGQWNLETTLQGHTGCIWSASFNPAGDRIVTASEDKTAKVWVLHSGQWSLEATLTGHEKFISCASFNTIGDHIITTSADNTAKVWILNGDQWILEATLQRHANCVWSGWGWVLSASFNIADNRIAIASDGNTAQIWHYTWHIDNTDLGQALLCVLAQREHERGRPLTLYAHRHLVPLWQRLPQTTKQHLIENYAVDPTMHWCNPAHWSSFAKTLTLTAVTICAAYGIKRWLRK
jgi:WD40 repeat protein